MILKKGTLNFGPCAARGHPELSPAGREMTYNDRGAYWYGYLHFAVIWPCN